MRDHDRGVDVDRDQLAVRTDLQHLGQQQVSGLGYDPRSVSGALGGPRRKPEASYNPDFADSARGPAVAVDPAVRAPWPYEVTRVSVPAATLPGSVSIQLNDCPEGLTYKL